MWPGLVWTRCRENWLLRSSGLTQEVVSLLHRSVPANIHLHITSIDFTLMTVYSRVSTDFCQIHVEIL